jgi:hypothetical protein
MKTSNIATKIVLLGCIMLLAVGCFDEDNFLNDNIEQTGRSFPNISDFHIENLQDSYAEGETLQLDLRFFSNDPIQTIILRDSLIDIREQQVVTEFSPDEASFSDSTQTQVLIMNYTVPSSVPNDPTQVNLEVEIVNENGLSITNVTADNFAIAPLNITVNQ